MTTNRAQLRLKNEYSLLINEPICNSTVKETNDLFSWNVIMQGPDSTPYEGGEFNLQFKFPDNYPFKAPEVRFVTPIYHPNIKLDTGDICQDIFTAGWAPTQKVTDILEKILSMLREPQTSTPLENDICQEYINNRELYNKNAREYTLKHAK